MAGPEASNSFHRNGSGEDSDTDYEHENIRPRGLTGLQNLGNTCYLNSALQSLSNCPPLTRYFLDCPTLIRPEKSPMLSRSYLKLISELWHKKRPSYVVPSGVVSGIKAVHPMFRGYTQQDAQEFLRCFMDQLHEELKAPALYSDDESDDEDENDHRMAGEDGNNSARLQSDSVHSHSFVEQKSTGSEVVNRRPSFDSLSSQSELEYETCESGLSSERSSNASRDNGFSGDESYSDTNDLERLRPAERMRKTSAMSAGSGNEDYQPALDTVANTKEMKETANLLEKETEMRRPRAKVVMEGGDSKDQGAAPYVAAVGKEAEGQAGPMSLEVHSKSPMKQNSSKPRKPKNVRFDSIISQTFDGKILSSVRCLNCETVSTTKETFQDLSLPIPSKDHLHMLHSGYHAVGGGGVSPPKGGACGEVHQSWLASMFTWMKSWFIGPTITLQDCLSAFFSADELKGDNMYSCEKCKKLRNGLKYSKVLELPEILSIHLKRFRHEFYSSKISTYIAFPLEGLDMSPYIHKGCNNEVTLYDLVAIICHHGTAGGGHYTAYCLNYLNGQWYEFDDQYVTEVDIGQVLNCEAYVLFYKKSNKKIEATRQRVTELEADETSIMKFYISKQWVSRFHTFAEPGPVTNVDFLCKHGGVPPAKVNIIDDLVFEIHQSTWELLYRTFGGGPVCNQLYACKTCHSELEKLRQRQHAEKESFIQLNEEFQEEEHAASVYAISMAWFKEWESFVREKKDTPPDAIDNSRICLMRNGLPVLRQNSDYGHLSKDMWLFLYRIYGGGPEVVIRQSTGVSVKKGVAAASNAQQPQANNQTLAALAARASSSAGGSTSLSQTASPSRRPPSPPAATTAAATTAVAPPSSSTSSPQAKSSSSPAVSTIQRKSMSSSSSSSTSVVPSVDDDEPGSLKKNNGDDASDEVKPADHPGAVPLAVSSSSSSPPRSSAADNVGEEAGLSHDSNAEVESANTDVESKKEPKDGKEDFESGSDKAPSAKGSSPKAEKSSPGCAHDADLQPALPESQASESELSIQQEDEREIEDEGEEDGGDEDGGEGPAKEVTPSQHSPRIRKMNKAMAPNSKELDDNLIHSSSDSVMSVASEKKSGDSASVMSAASEKKSGDSDSVMSTASEKKSGDSDSGVSMASEKKSGDSDSGVSTASEKKSGDSDSGMSAASEKKSGDSDSGVSTASEKKSRDSDSGVSSASEKKSSDSDSVMTESNEEKKVEDIPSVTVTSLVSKDNAVLKSPSSRTEQKQDVKGKVKNKKGKQMNVTRI